MNMPSVNKSSLIILITPALLLLLGLHGFDRAYGEAYLPVLPYFSYVLLRIIVTVSCAFFIFSMNKAKHDTLTLHKLILCGMIILYNPIFSIHMGQEDWVIANIISAIYLFYFIRKIFIPSN